VKTEALPVGNERSLPKLSSKIVLLSTSVISPSFFYCVLPFDTCALDGLRPETCNILQMLEELTNEMTAHYRLDAKHKRSASLFVAGEAVIPIGSPQIVSFRAFCAGGSRVLR
jgi:hypothetical protein